MTTTTPSTPDSDGPDSIDRVDRLVAEYADRLARDEDPRREELLGQAPEYRAELERCFLMLEDGEPGGAGQLAAGLELGDFSLGHALGRGGMAVVYEAEQKSLGRRVALKVLRQHLTLDEKARARFQREARAAAKLQHENVVPIHSVGEADGHAFIAFERVEGPTLARVIDSLAALGRRPIPADLARASGMASIEAAGSYAEACVQLLGGVFSAVQHAHERGIIHRDLKPSNVLLTGAGKPMVSDFGLAKDMGEASLSLTGETIGTPHYMSPEQAGALANRVDARSDVYSLGVTLYELLTLRRPFRGDTFQELVQSIITVTPRSPCEVAADIPTKVGDVVLKALAKDPGERYARVADFAKDLANALTGAAILAQPSHGIAALFGGWFEAKIRGVPFEYRSKRSLFGLPWIHVVSGLKDPKTNNPRWAKGVIACGDFAVGAYAAGKVAFGLLALGGIAFGPIALGAMAFGIQAIGGVVFGWNAEGVMVAGVEGRGLVSEWLLHPMASPAVASSHADHDPSSSAFQVSFVCIVLSLTGTYGIWSRMWRGEGNKRFLRRLTRIWMPIAYLLPALLALAGFELPFMANLVLIMAITGAFGGYVRLKLGAPART